MSSLTEGIRILRCFSEAEPELRLSEISRRLELSKGNTHRLLTMLVAEGLVRRDAHSARYRLGLGLYELGQVAVSEVDLRPALPRMMELGKLTDETILLGVLDDLDVVYVQRVESPRTLRVTHGPRERGPAHCTATGKVLLAWRPEPEIERFIRHGLPRHSARTITDADQFRAALKEIRELGYAVNDQEREMLIRSVSAPVRDARGIVVAALTVAGPSQRLARPHFQRVIDLVVKAAGELSRDLNQAALNPRHIRAS
ncbi:MAG: IclR family transcriptional regulator [Chloroflexota bacterium]